MVPLSGDLRAEHGVTGNGDSGSRIGARGLKLRGVPGVNSNGDSGDGRLYGGVPGLITRGELGGLKLPLEGVAAARKAASCSAEVRSK